MKRKTGLYDKIISKENLILADKMARKGKLKQYGVKKHVLNEVEGINNLYEILNHRKFETSEYNVFEITQPKQRIIARLPYYP